MGKPYSEAFVPGFKNGYDYVIDFPLMRKIYFTGINKDRIEVKGAIDAFEMELRKNPTSTPYKNALEQLLNLKSEILSIEQRVMVV
jgi:hypothetical protein